MEAKDVVVIVPFVTGNIYRMVINIYGSHIFFVLFREEEHAGVLQREEHVQDPGDLSLLPQLHDRHLQVPARRQPQIQLHGFSIQHLRIADLQFSCSFCFIAYIFAVVLVLQIWIILLVFGLFIII